MQRLGGLVLAGFSLIVGRDNGPDLEADDLLDRTVKSCGFSIFLHAASVP